MSICCASFFFLFPPFFSFLPKCYFVIIQDNCYGKCYRSMGECIGFGVGRTIAKRQQIISVIPGVVLKHLRSGNSWIFLCESNNDDTTNKTILLELFHCCVGVARKRAKVTGACVALAASDLINSLLFMRMFIVHRFFLSSNFNGQTDGAEWRHGCR